MVFKPAFRTIYAARIRNRSRSSHFILFNLVLHVFLYLRRVLAHRIGVVTPVSERPDFVFTLQITKLLIPYQATFSLQISHKSRTLITGPKRKDLRPPPTSELPPPSFWDAVHLTGDFLQTKKNPAIKAGFWHRQEAGINLLSHRALRVYGRSRSDDVYGYERKLGSLLPVRRHR